MSRYGWSNNREHSSPYSSMSGGVPAVTDEDFSYITSQDLEDPTLGRSDGRHLSSSPNSEDDILLVKNKGVTYPTHFPAYAIGDGKLRVKDVRDRVGLTMALSDSATRRIKLLYKGKQLKEPAAPVRDYGVKNKSELMAVLPEGADASSPSGEETVVVGDAPRASGKSRSRKNKKNKKNADRGDGESTSSPRDSNSNLGGPKSPSPTSSGPMKKLDELSGQFNSKWLPLCVQYSASPPSDPKKREDEHRKLSESVLQQILLKLDEVDTEGIDEVRAKRKDLVKRVQEVLKGLDTAKST